MAFYSLANEHGDDEEPGYPLVERSFLPEPPPPSDAERAGNAADDQQ